MPKQRLDVLLHAAGFAVSREQAQRLILAGEVTVGGKQVTKPGTKVDGSLPLVVKTPPPFVSRGGLKLAGALKVFPVDPAGKVCLDIGSSTGGFTDCLLQHGAVRVHAVDVGTNQLVWKLRSDPRVIVREQFNARYLTPDDLGEKVQLIVSDVSFISLTKILPAAFSCLEEGGDIIVLVKPTGGYRPGGHCAQSHPARARRRKDSPFCHRGAASLVDGGIPFPHHRYGRQQGIPRLAALESWYRYLTGLLSKSRTLA